MAGAEQGPGQDQGLPQRIAGALNRLRGKDTPTPEDQIWEQYMGKRRDWRELAALVTDGQVQLEYQQRAIEVLLAPDIRRLPFPVNVDTALHTYTHVSNDWVGNITEAQAGFIAERIPEYIQQAGQAIQRDKHDYGARDALFIYNGLIPRLLGKLLPEQAERLFENFSINDPLSYWGMETASEYNPLKGLYHDRTVDESWKRRAASQIHKVIQREQSGEATPRVEHEAAAVNYSQALGAMLYGKEGLPVSREFYQEEIAFMLGVETGKPIVESWHTGQVLDLLDDAELRHIFARRQVLTGEPDSFDRFTVYDDARARTARRIINEFPEDTDLRTYLEQQLQEWQVRSEQNAQLKEQAARTEQEIMARMKQPALSN